MSARSRLTSSASFGGFPPAQIPRFLTVYYIDFSRRGWGIFWPNNEFLYLHTVKSFQLIERVYNYVGTSYLDELLQLQVKFCWSIFPPPTYKFSAGYMSKTTDSTQWGLHIPALLHHICASSHYNYCQKNIPTQTNIKRSKHKTTKFHLFAIYSLFE